jgi:hypothetical protein
MTPERLKQLTGHAFTTGEPKKLAEQLRARYVECARRFGQIITLAPGHSQIGRLMSADINLGAQDAAGKVSNVARIAMTSFDPADRRSGFSVVTIFEAIDRANKRRVQIDRECFGTLGAGFSSGIAAVPAFVRNPNTSCDGPWDQAVPGHRYPLETAWNDDNYVQVASVVNRMIDQAEDTQKMLITAMQDETLNGPDLATRAAGLMLPSAVTA